MKRRKFLGASALVVGGATTAAAANRGPIKLWEYIFPDAEIAPARHKPDPASWSDREVTAAWIGHSTVLINFFGTRIVTDPILSAKAGVRLLGLLTIGPRRITAPALTLEELGGVDLILLSHAHMDHLDYPTVSDLASKEREVVMAKHTSDVIDGLEFKRVREVDWGEKIDACGLTIEAVEVRHFGWRFPWEKDRSRGERDGRSYNALLVRKNGISILFGGDTAYTSAFRKVGASGDTVDLAIMPIGTYNPWRRAHCNPEEAIAMCREMNARAILPIHWNTFIVSDEPVMEPIERLKKGIPGSGISLALDAIGKTVTVG